MAERLKRLSRLQRVNPQRDAGVEPYLEVYANGSHTWTCPKTARYEFAGWGAGGSNAGGGGAALTIITRRIRKGQTVALSVAAAASTAPATTITLPDGTVATAGPGAAGADGAAGTATGGDINVAGTAGSGTTGGPAASFGKYRGGTAPGSIIGGNAPGGGSGNAGASGGTGLVIITRVA